MPSTPYAKLLVSVNGGAPTSGGITVAAGDSIQFSFENVAGWGSPVARVEFYSFPTAWSGPAGWSLESKTFVLPDGSSVVADVFYKLGNTPPPAFTMPAAWGKYLVSLQVLGGAEGTPLYDLSTGLEIVSAGGLHDLAWRESQQFSGDAWKKWVGDHQANLRIIESGIAAAANASVAPDASKILLRGVSGEGRLSWLETAASGCADVGEIRTPNGTTAIAARNFLNNNNFSMLRSTTGNRVVVASTTAAGVDVDLPTGGEMHLVVNNVTAQTFNATSIALASTSGKLTADGKDLVALNGGQLDVGSTSTSATNYRSAGSHTFIIAGTTEMVLASGDLDVVGNGAKIKVAGVPVAEDNAGNLQLGSDGFDTLIKGQGIAFFDATPIAQAVAIAPLTDSTTGTANNTVNDVGAAFNQATLNNNFADLVAKVNALTAILRDYGLIDT